MISKSGNRFPAYAKPLTTVRTLVYCFGGRRQVGKDHAQTKKLECDDDLTKLSSRSKRVSFARARPIWSRLTSDDRAAVPQSPPHRRARHLAICDKPVVRLRLRRTSADGRSQTEYQEAGSGRL